MNRSVAIAAILASLAGASPAQDRSGPEPRRGPRGAEDRPRRERPGPTTLPAAVRQFQELSVVLGRPTDKSVTASVLSAQQREGYIEYGTASGRYDARSETVKLPAGKAVEIVLEKLDRDRRYYYRLQCRRPGETAFTAGAEESLHTQRSPGSEFLFEIQGDSHPERPHQFDAALYAQTLLAAAADRPDFYMTIGDDFSVDNLRAVDAGTVEGVYRGQRMFLGLLAGSVPVMLVNGNHEQAAMCNLDGTANNVAVWSQTARNGLFPQPGPDGFYSGDAQPVKFIGLLRDYYAWTWGDALFVVIDPYWHSPKPVDNVYGGGPKSRDLWAVTLGKEQYQWLKATLEGSKAKFKFVFTHHVLGTGRGGIEQADLFEWGGKDKRGEDQFAARRPGWKLPIHQLMAQNGVSIFFQGHDHVFARQQLDGVVYQSLPEPADASYALYNKEAYRSGDVLGNSGRVRVSVSPAKVRVEYVRSWLPKDANGEHRDGESALAYEVAAGGAQTKPATVTSRPASVTSRPAAADVAESRPSPRGSRGPQGSFLTDVPPHPLDVVLGRPTANSITLSVLCYAGAKAYVAYGTAKDDLASRGEAVDLPKGEPREIVLAGLKPDTAYCYQLRNAATDKPLAGAETAGAFHTQRKPGSAFTFTVQADSHLDENTSIDVYLRTLANVQADSPDFHIDLGDTFMTDKHAGRDSAARQYLAQRYYLGLVGRSVPVFLVLGNHDGEDSKLLRGPDSLAAWSNATRKRYFPNPVPDGFYSGDTTKDPRAGLLQDYYAWQWGDALFVVLNPYWHSTGRRADDTWGLTLGREQYDWLAKTLEASKAKLRFVFIHQLAGGLDKQGRGGAEATPFGEWGGKNADGSDGFGDRRPGWPMPVHPLLVKHHVTAVFHGHDHLFCQQQRDGVVYQEVPQPGFAGVGEPRSAAEYGYTSGVILGGSGHIRVTVGEGSATIGYVRALPARLEDAQRKNGQVECVKRIGP